MTPKALIRDGHLDCTAKHIQSSVPYPLRFFPDEENDTGLLCHALFGRVLHFGELISLCGGEPGKSEITIGVAKSGLYLEFQHAVIGCVGACLICRAADSRLVLVNEHVRFLQRDGIEKRKFHWFSRQKAACEALGIATIHIVGSRSSISQGYFYYPLFGFNAPAPLDFLHILPKEINHCLTLLDLYEYPQGRKIWFLHGFSCDMMFDLHNKNNQSRLIFDRYSDFRCRLR